LYFAAGLRGVLILVLHCFSPYLARFLKLMLTWEQCEVEVKF